MSVTVGVLRLPHHDPALPLPAYATSGAAGLDLCANLAPADRAAGLTLAPGARALVPSGLSFAIPEGFEVQVRPRSGLALRHGIGLVNSPGTIDSDYRGEVGVILINHGEAPFTVEHGTRIAQLVLAPVVTLVWDEQTSLEASARGAGGFGSTGTSSTGTASTGTDSTGGGSTDTGPTGTGPTDTDTAGTDSTGTGLTGGGSTRSGSTGTSSTGTGQP